MLKVDDGTGLTDSNSYVTVEEADAYHVDHGNAAWAAGAQADKEAALVRATSYIDRHYRWKGVRNNSAQALMWPRWDVYDDIGNWYTGIPVKLKQATCEAALRELKTSDSLDPDLDRGGQVQSVTVGPVSTTYAPGAPGRTLFPILDRLLSDLAYVGNGVHIVRG